MTVETPPATTLFVPPRAMAAERTRGQHRADALQSRGPSTVRSQHLPPLPARGRDYGRMRAAMRPPTTAWQCQALPEGPIKSQCGQSVRSWFVGGIGDDQTCWGQRSGLSIGGLRLGRMRFPPSP